MRTSRAWWTVLALFVLAALRPAPALAQDRSSADAIKAEIEQLKQDFNNRLTALETRLAALEQGSAVTGAAQAAAVPADPSAVGASGALPTYGGPAASKAFNPDIAVIGNFLGAAGKNPINGQPALQMSESEMSLQAVVDPYARADFYLSFGEQGVDLEEGFISFTTLPGGLLAKVGKMKAAFGKVNTLHSHVLPWADRPIVLENLLGGDDGINDAGVSVARLIPNPWIFLEATGQVFRGDSGDLFQSRRRRDLSYVAHLRAYRDLSESANLDVGGSFAHGHNPWDVDGGIDMSRFTTDLFGVDATVRWRPLQRAIYHSFIGRTEAVWSRSDQVDGRQAASGFFASGDYQLGRRWYAGARYDRSGRADAGDQHDRATSLTLTYWPSEFSQVRGQVRRTEFAEGITANELLFQLQFAIGAHGAHPF